MPLSGHFLMHSPDGHNHATVISIHRELNREAVIVDKFEVSMRIRHRRIHTSRQIWNFQCVGWTSCYSEVRIEANSRVDCGAYLANSTTIVLNVLSMADNCCQFIALFSSPRPSNSIIAKFLSGIDDCTIQNGAHKLNVELPVLRTIKIDSPIGSQKVWVISDCEYVREIAYFQLVDVGFARKISIPVYHVIDGDITNEVTRATTCHAPSLNALRKRAIVVDVEWSHVVRPHIRCRIHPIHVKVIAILIGNGTA